eukprot:889836-Pyramimonas_sp.AAC.1
MEPGFRTNLLLSYTGHVPSKASGAMPWHAMRCCVVLHCAMPCFAMLRFVMQCYTMYCQTML